MEYISRHKINKYRKDLKKHEFIWGKSQRIFHLTEEVGEFSEIYLQYTKKKRPFKNLVDIENGLTDIFDDVLALSLLFNLNINNIIEKTLKT